MTRSRTIDGRPPIDTVRARFRDWGLLRRLSADALIAGSLMLLVIVGTVIGYRQRMVYTLPRDGEIGLYIDGLSAPETDDTGTHRWTAPRTLMRFPGVGQAAYRITLMLHNPQTGNRRELSVGTDAGELARLVVPAGWRQVQVDIPADAVDRASGNLDLIIGSDPPFKAGSRSLGVALRDLQLQQAQPALAPSAVQWLLAVTTLLLFLLLRIVGVPGRWAGLAAAGLLVLALVLVVESRIGLLIGLPLIRQALLLGLLAAPFLRLWSHLQGSAAWRWSTAVALVALGSFVVRYAGMQHPQFVTIDHILRVHQIQAIAAGQRAAMEAKLSRQYEWGRGITVPYSLLSYDLFVPIAPYLSTTRLVKVVEGVSAALDASVVLLLWHLARRSRIDVTGSGWTAALYGVLPVGYLYFHDGSYPTIIGLWMTVVALLVLTYLVERPRIWLAVAGAVAVMLSILMYVTHLAFVPALLAFTIASAFLLGGAALRHRLGPVILAAVAGFTLAFLVYYGRQLPELIGTTVPSYFATLSGGGSVGRDASVLPGALLGSTLRQLWGHYRLILIPLALLGVVIALNHRERWSTHLVVGYAVFLALTIVVDQRFGLWNKHMYFAMPGVCLAAGPVLGSIQRRSRIGQVLVFGLFAYLLYTSIGAWLLRVIWYIWSLQTL